MEIKSLQQLRAEWGRMVQGGSVRAAAGSTYTKLFAGSFVGTPIVILTRKTGDPGSITSDVFGVPTIGVASFTYTAKKGTPWLHWVALPCYHPAR